MTASLSELIEQKEALERQIRRAQENAKAEALAKVRALMTEHGLTLADLTLLPSRKGMNAGAKVAPKYRDPTSGVTWSGGWLKPRWLTSALEAGRSLEEFAIQVPTPLDTEPGQEDFADAAQALQSGVFTKKWWNWQAPCSIRQKTSVTGFGP